VVFTAIKANFCPDDGASADSDDFSALWHALLLLVVLEQPLLLLVLVQVLVLVLSLWVLHDEGDTGRFPHGRMTLSALWQQACATSMLVFGHALRPNPEAGNWA